MHWNGPRINLDLHTLRTCSQSYERQIWFERSCRGPVSGWGGGGRGGSIPSWTNRFSPFGEWRNFRLSCQLSTFYFFGFLKRNAVKIFCFVLFCFRGIQAIQCPFCQKKKKEIIFCWMASMCSMSVLVFKPADSVSGVIPIETRVSDRNRYFSFNFGSIATKISYN